MSEPYKQDLLKQYNVFLEALKVYDSTKVTPAHWQSIGVMKWDCEIKLEGLKNQLVTVASPMFDMPTFELFPLTQMQSLHLYFSQLAGKHSVY